MKRLIIGLVTIAMFVFINRVDASAAVTADSEEELIASLAEGEDVVLGSDIYVYENIYSECSCNIDMNGHDIIFAVTEDEEGYLYSGSLFFGSTVEKAKITDSVGGGAFRDEDREIPGALTSEAVNLEISGVEISFLCILSGNVVISDCHMGNFECSGSETFVEFKEGTVSKEYDINGGTYNFDVSEYLVLGFFSVDNGDGTYTTQFKKIEQTGNTYTIYFDNYLEDIEEYYLSDLEDTKKAPEKLMLEVLYVMGDDESTISYPMNKVDKDGKFWSAEIDRAYYNAIIQVEYEAGDVSSTLMVAPDKDGIIVDSDGNYHSKEGSEIESSIETPSESDNNNWIFVVVGAVVLVVATVAIVLIVLKKKK